MNYHDILDALLRNVPVRSFANFNQRNVRQNAAFQKQVHEYVRFMKDLMAFEPWLFNETIQRKLAEYISIELKDLVNGLFYIFIYVVMPVMYREKSVKPVTGIFYHSFQFPECVPIATKYFQANEQSTINGLRFIHQYVISMDVHQMVESIRALLGRWRRFTTEDYITFVLPVSSNKTCELEFFEAIHGNQRNVQNDRIQGMFVYLLNRLLDKSFRYMGIRQRVQLRDRTLYIPNIWNPRLVQNVNNRRSTQMGTIIFAVMYMLSYYSDLCASGLSVMKQTDKIHELVKTVRFDIVSPEEFFRVHFGFTNTKSAQNGKLSLPMTLLYLKLVVSLLRVQRGSLSEITAELCGFYHTFLFDRNDPSAVREVKQMVQVISPFFYLFSPRIPRFRNHANYRFDPNMRAIVSVYTSLFQVLKVIRSGAVSAESGFLESTQRALDHRLLLASDPALEALISRWVVAKNTNNNRTNAKALETQLRNRVLRDLGVNPLVAKVFVPASKVLVPAAKVLRSPVVRAARPVGRFVRGVLAKPI
jgi:hypothetical protein